MKPIPQRFFLTGVPLIALSFTALVWLTPEGAGAKTPDGSPPSEEVVCDGQQGALYGLCNAYCEAMDCDSAAPHASATACTAVLDNFLRKSGGDLPPCEEVAVQCPCWDEELLSTALQQALDVGLIIGGCGPESDGGATLTLVGPFGPSHFASARRPPSTNVCQLLPLDIIVFNLTEEEVTVCAEQILALCP